MKNAFIKKKHNMQKRNYEFLIWKLKEEERKKESIFE